MSNILLVDDDVEFCEMLKQYLEREGFVINTVHDGEQAVNEVRKGGYEIVVMDVMMPKMNGFDALRELRRDSQVPVLMLTARGDDVDSIVGLELGADDYLPKPCNPRVLVARIRALLRRYTSGDASHVDGHGPGIIRVGDLEMNTGSREVTISGAKIVMTGTEFGILEVLLKQAGCVVAKDMLSELGLGRQLSRYDRAIDMHVSNLRKKLGPLANGNERIKTVRGKGYQYIHL